MVGTNHAWKHDDEALMQGKRVSRARVSAGGKRAFAVAQRIFYGVIVTLVTFHRIAEPRYTTLGSLQPISWTRRPASSSPRPRLVCAQPTTLSVVRSIL